MRTAITNIGTIVSGDWTAPFVEGDTIVMADGRIESAGTASSAAVESCDVVIDAGGTTATPGFIDRTARLGRRHRDGRSFARELWQGYEVRLESELFPALQQR